jgi:hypothetical protein
VIDRRTCAWLWLWLWLWSWLRGCDLRGRIRVNNSGHDKHDEKMRKKAVHIYIRAAQKAQRAWLTD